MVAIAYLGPPGTYAEIAALTYQSWLADVRHCTAILKPYPSIAQSLQAVADSKVDCAVVPVENSTEGSVTVTLDMLWQLDRLQIQHAIVLPIAHALLSYSTSLSDVRVVYSHPQALAQCQHWLEISLPQARLIPTASTIEAVSHLRDDSSSSAISSVRAAELHELPILARGINDYPDNCTRFWAVSRAPSRTGRLLSLAFITPDRPGSLVAPLAVFAERGLNLTRIESRPTKRSLGEYLFFVDLEGDMQDTSVRAALNALPVHTEVLKIFGNYDLLPTGSTRYTCSIQTC
ncbi:prephenate dehydratase [Rubidibacter lacunae KORDI 51-2]|uniref:Prephenate dehydratase n=2 Tax=Rubidibacter TaxID=582491 RepID=U5DPD9_9CHRO|nr:prephenate dehydratase [Rubidibacter lacunae KORDI 51-2]